MSTSRGHQVQTPIDDSTLGLSSLMIHVVVYSSGGFNPVGL